MLSRLVTTSASHAAACCPVTGGRALASPAQSPSSVCEGAGLASHPGQLGSCSQPPRRGPCSLLPGRGHPPGGPRSGGASPPPGHQATRDAASEGGSSGSRRGSWAWWGRQAEPQPESALCRMADCLEDSWGQKPLSASLLGRGAGRPWERPLFPGRQSLAWERHLTPALAEGSAFSPAPTGAAGRSGLEAGPGGLDWPLRTVTPLLSAPHPHASPPLNPASVRSRGPHRDGEGHGAGSRLLSLRACSVTGDPPTPRHFQQPWVGSGGCLPEVCFPRWCRGSVRHPGPPGLWGDGVILYPPVPSHAE